MSQFDEVIPRIGTNSEKWDGAEELFGRKDIIPMWVADMDFRAPKPVLDAFQRQIDHGIFGYSTKSKALVEAVMTGTKSSISLKSIRARYFLTERLFRQSR